MVEIHLQHVVNERLCTTFGRLLGKKVGQSAIDVLERSSTVIDLSFFCP